MAQRSSVVGALTTLVLAGPAAALLVHCSSFGASEEPAAAGEAGVAVESGSADAGDGSTESDGAAGADGGASFCATAHGGLVCEDFETPAVLDDARFEVVNKVDLESPGFESAHGIVATAAAKSNAVFAVPTALPTSAKHITISAAIRFDGPPMTAVDLIAVEIGARTMELYVRSDLRVSFASCNGATCEDLTTGTQKLSVGKYARLELSLDLTGPRVIASGTVAGAAAFAKPIVVSALAGGTTFDSLFGVVYSDAAVSVHVDDVYVRAD